MGSKIEYVDSTHMAATNYVRNSKAISVLWAIFTICYCVISCVALLTPEWIGRGDAEQAGGRAGVWQACRHAPGLAESCEGRLEELWLPGAVFRVTAVLVGLAACLAGAAVCAMLLFFFCRSTTVFHICGWLHLLSALSMILGVALYPAAWDQAVVRDTCGPDADQYKLGDCSVRWAYLLAGLACLDAVILSTLAFILATRHITLHADSVYNNGSLCRGEINNAYLTDGSVAGSRKSLALQPVLLVPPRRDLEYLRYERRHKPHL